MKKGAFQERCLGWLVGHDGREEDLQAGKPARMWSRGRMCVCDQATRGRAVAADQCSQHCGTLAYCPQDFNRVHAPPILYA